MIKMSTSCEWLLKRSEAEDAGDVAVGGLACQVGLVKSDRTQVTERTAFAKLVEFRRRDCGLTLEQLAEKADVDLEEMVGIERGYELPSEPRTVHQIATILRLSPNRLMELAGFVERRDRRLHDAAIKFAARSGAVSTLNAEEHKALKQFVELLDEA